MDLNSVDKESKNCDDGRVSGEHWSFCAHSARMSMQTLFDAFGDSYQQLFGQHVHRILILLIFFLPGLFEGHSLQQ
jgi:hypothetical protein